MAVITISRQYGSTGDDIARQVCKALGYRYFDTRTLVRIASSMGLTEGEFVDVTEDTYHRRIGQHLLSRIRYLPAANILQTMMMPAEETFAKMANWAEDTTGASVKQERWLSERDECLFIRDVILKAYEEGNFVIVGRGGQMILRDKPGVLHVRIVAPEDARVTNIVAQQHLNVEAAIAAIHQHDRDAADYIDTSYHADWNDPLLYHLIINTDFNSVEWATQAILAAAQRLFEGKLPTRQYGLPQNVEEFLQAHAARIAA